MIQGMLTSCKMSGNIHPLRIRILEIQGWATWFLLHDDLGIYWDQTQRLDQLMPAYTADPFPFSDLKKAKELMREYRAMPEEFYTKTGKRPIIPGPMDEGDQVVRNPSSILRFWSAESYSRPFSWTTT